MFPFLESRMRKKELAGKGLYIENVHNPGGQKRLVICLLRGLMVFLACYGTIVGLVGAFGIPFHHPIVFLSLLAISLFTAFLYYNKPIFYVGYFAILIGFTYALVRYYYYANSGYQAIVNIIYEEYSDFFHLLTLREAQEFITDRYTTVTFAMVFVGILLAILLNVTISGYMNLLETILITFPFLEIAFYIEKRPPLYCMIMVLACYICVGFQQAGKYFRMSVKGRRTPEYYRQRRKKSTTYIYQSSAMGTLQTILFSLILAIVIGLGFYPSYYAKVPVSPNNVIRETTDNYVKIFVQSGFTGLLDRYDSTGGLNHGRLGGVSSIRPDFETDLIVTFAPYSYETIYLKGFTGSFYDENQWIEHTYLNTYPDAVYYSDKLSLYADNEDFVNRPNLVFMDKEAILTYDAMYQPATASAGKMMIQNVGADTSYEYLPYYSSTDDVIKETLYVETSDSNEPMSVIMYHPYLGHYNEPTEAYALPVDYDLYVHHFCLQIPDDLRPVLEAYCADEKFPGIVSSSFEDAPASAEDINAYRLEVAQAIYEHFVEEYDYTMSPGTTPYGKDFVEYFLTTQKRGVCAHFAASATMLLRSMGVPARYVEGYCIPLSVMSEGRPVDEKYDQWYQGPTQVDKEGVLQVSVTDANAHAWVEIYLEGYGFVPFEMTPPDFLDEEPFGFDFGNLFGDLFSINLTMENAPQNTGNTDISFERNEIPLLSFSFDTAFVPLLIMVGVILSIILLIILSKKWYEHYKLNRLQKCGKYADIIYIYYNTLCKLLSRIKKEMPINPLPDELCRQLESLLPESEEVSDEETLKSNHAKRQEIKSFLQLTEKALYAPDGITTDEFETYEKLYENITKLLRDYRKSKRK